MKKLIGFLTFLLIVNCSLKIENCSSQWVFQSLPSYYDVGGIKFFDENTGILIGALNSPGMLRTTNGGYNWQLISSTYYCSVEKIDNTTLYLIADRPGGQYWLKRTFDKGVSFDSIYLPYSYRGISFINKDTGWISGSNELYYHAIFMTTNKGVTFNQLTDTTGFGNIFFLKNKVSGEFIGWHYSSTGDDKFWKTTNSGVNWFQATRPPAQYPGYFEFLNENTGWFTWYATTSGGIYKTTNGGFNWTNQYVPSGNGIHNTFTVFDIINADTLYGGGGYRLLPGGIEHGIVWKTTNGGTNWGYQEPDSSIHVGTLNSINFINNSIGWLFGGDGIHTSNGGGPINFTAINNNTQIIAKDYILYQNYPNPFNPSTKIAFDLPRDGKVKLVIYDILGRQIKTLVDNELRTAGKYTIEFNGSNLASGVYFYRLQVENGKIFTAVKKMVMVK